MNSKYWIANYAKENILNHYVPNSITYPTIKISYINIFIAKNIILIADKDGRESRKLINIKMLSMSIEKQSKMLINLILFFKAKEEIEQEKTSSASNKNRNTHKAVEVD